MYTYSRSNVERSSKVPKGSVDNSLKCKYLKYIHAERVTAERYWMYFQNIQKHYIIINCYKNKAIRPLILVSNITIYNDD